MLQPASAPLLRSDLRCGSGVERSIVARVARCRRTSQPMRSPLGSGNHPSIRDSVAHRFVRLSRGAWPILGDSGQEAGTRICLDALPCHRFVSEPADRALSASLATAPITRRFTPPSSRASSGRTPLRCARARARWKRSDAQWSASPDSALSHHRAASHNAGTAVRPWRD